MPRLVPYQHPNQQGSSLGHIGARTVTETSIQVLPNEDDNVDRVQQALQSRRQSVEINHLVREIEQSNRQLEKQKADLLAKNERLATLCESSRVFVNHVSHEFRTPLCVIKQYSNMFALGLFGEVAEEHKRILAIIEDRVDGLNNLVDDMLDISRLEAGLLSAQRKRCSLDEVLSREIPGLAARAKVRDVLIHEVATGDIPDVFCDPEKVGRTLTNLVTNAIKHSPKDSAIAITATSDPKANEVTVSIADQGPGISVEEQKRIFEHFEQTTTTKVLAEKGFGLGLGIAKQLAELNLGKIQVVSEIDKGATFEFTLPTMQHESIVSRHREYVCNQTKTEILVLTEIEVSFRSETPSKSRANIENLLQFLIRSKDLLLPENNGKLRLTLATNRSGAYRFFDRLNKEAEACGQNGHELDLDAMEWQINETKTLTRDNFGEWKVDRLVTDSVARFGLPKELKAPKLAKITRRLPAIQQFAAAESPTGVMR